MEEKVTFIKSLNIKSGLNEGVKWVYYELIDKDDKKYRVYKNKKDTTELTKSFTQLEEITKKMINMMPVEIAYNEVPAEFTDTKTGKLVKYIKNYVGFFKLGNIENKIENKNEESDYELEEELENGINVDEIPF